MTDKPDTYEFKPGTDIRNVTLPDTIKPGQTIVIKNSSAFDISVTPSKLGVRPKDG